MTAPSQPRFVVWQSTNPWFSDDYAASGPYDSSSVVTKWFVGALDSTGAYYTTQAMFLNSTPAIAYAAELNDATS